MTRENHVWRHEDVLPAITADFGGWVMPSPEISLSFRCYGILASGEWMCPESDGLDACSSGVTRTYFFTSSWGIAMSEFQACAR